MKTRYGHEGMSAGVRDDFQQLVYRHSAEHRRNLPWRVTREPWSVLVSEVMLQQTQVDRVIPKFLLFMERFPSPAALAQTSQAELLAAWQGLGYNRRALSLQRAARMIVEQWHGQIPAVPDQLQLLPGIGPYTAGAILAFAFDMPLVFLETNIRAVLLYVFFEGQEGVGDRRLLQVAEAVLDREHPRDWYNALMDYGSDLKRRFPNPSRRSRHHTVQSRFEGSDRQIRGAVLRHLLSEGAMMKSTLCQRLVVEPERLQRILDTLVLEGFAVLKGRRYLIP